VILLLTILFGLRLFGTAALAQSPNDVDRNWNPELVQALELAGSNREEIEQLLRNVPDEHWDSAKFLVSNMPARDLKSLKCDFLKSNIALAHQSLEIAPWGKQIPKDIFLNNILPYANINERRDAWREEFRERFAPLIAEANSPSHAAALLNARLFPLVNVKYSTKRAKADQSPQESMKSGLASCTGLSVLLIDACRALAIPARFVGTPLWSDNSGNHSWVEIWDDGWHFTGAAEPSGEQLDQAWFTGRAATAERDDPQHAIYAVSFQKTPLRFPLVWDPSIDYISAVNVTDRYTRIGTKPPEGTQVISFRVLDPRSRSRIVASVRVLDEQGTVVLEGKTKDERFDANDHLHQTLIQGASYTVEVEANSQTWSDRFRVDGKPQLLSWELPADEPTTPGNSDALGDSTGDQDPVLALSKYLRSEVSDRPPLAAQSFAAQPLTREQAEAAEKLLVADYQAVAREARRVEFEAKEITLGGLKMPFSYVVFGEKPASGRSLYISMHGGGGAPKEVNDSQWENQKKLYKLDEGVYVAPRAPTNTWDLWHQSHIDAMFDRLIEDFFLFEDVDPDRVYLMGYSAGGDGVYQLAPRMADRFAAASMMAGHPNETSPLGLRNLPFAIHMGEKDAAYNRNQTAQQWKEKLEELQQGDPEGYQHIVKLHEGKGHWMDRQDAEALTWMHSFTRDRFPKRIVWKQDDVAEDRFYWLAVDRAGLPDRALVIAEVDGQAIQLEQCDPRQLTILLRDDWIDMSQEIVIQYRGAPIATHHVTRTIAAMDDSLRQRGDPKGVFWGKLQVSIPAEASKPKE
jgi:poly(3-hydroxybutyrate) depolymerase